MTTMKNVFIVFLHVMSDGRNIKNLFSIHYKKLLADANILFLAFCLLALGYKIDGSNIAQILTLEIS